MLTQSWTRIPAPGSLRTPAPPPPTPQTPGGRGREHRARGQVSPGGTQRPAGAAELLSCPRPCRLQGGGGNNMSLRWGEGVPWGGAPWVAMLVTRPRLCSWQKLGPSSNRARCRGEPREARLRSSALTAVGRPTWSPPSVGPAAQGGKRTCPRARGLPSHSPRLVPLPRRAAAHSSGTAGTHQVAGGCHQLVGGEREGLVAQVRVEHLLENGSAGSERSQSDSQSTDARRALCAPEGHWGRGRERDRLPSPWGRHGAKASTPHEEHAPARRTAGEAAGQTRQTRAIRRRPGCCLPGSGPLHGGPAHALHFRGILTPRLPLHPHPPPRPC